MVGEEMERKKECGGGKKRFGVKLELAGLCLLEVNTLANQMLPLVPPPFGAWPDPGFQKLYKTEIR
jgi:hypothetical protein